MVWFDLIYYSGENWVLLYVKIGAWVLDLCLDKSSGPMRSKCIFIDLSDPNIIEFFEISQFYWFHLLILEKMKSCLWKLGLGFWTHGFIATSFGSKDENNLPPITDWMSGVTCCISFIHVAQQLPSCSCTSEFWKTLLAKPNPDANYFYLMRGELTKIGEYMTSFSKIVGKN